MTQSEDFDYDLIVLGAGSGGVRAARISAGYGARVAVIEKDRPGGTCVIRGCVPKKLLVYASSVAADIEDAAGFGWQIGEVSHDFGALIAAKDAEIDRLEQIYRSLLKNAGAELIEGHGRITGPHMVEVGGRSLSARHILIATGGWPHIPDIPGLRDAAITSNEALDLKELPKEIVIFGSGYIALEFACIFNGLGAKTHLVYRSDLPLRGFDEDIRRHITTALEDRGIHLHANRTISEVRGEAGGYQVTLDSGEGLGCEQIMAATGRLPNTHNLGLDDVGVSQNDRGAIIVDSEERTSVPSILAIGDVTDRVNLTPVAIGEGHALADRLFGGMDRRFSHDNIASAVFSQPPIASVGLSEVQAQAEYGELDVYESQFRAMKNTLSGRPEKTYMKLIVERDSQIVRGVHMMGPDAGEIMQGIAIAVKMGATKADFDSVVGIHPTAAEEFVTMRTKRQS